MARVITLDNDGNNASATVTGETVPAQTGTPATPGTRQFVVYNATGGAVSVRVTGSATGVTVEPAEVKINGGKSAVVTATNTTGVAHTVTVAAGDAFTTHRTSAAVGNGRNLLYIG